MAYYQVFYRRKGTFKLAQISCDNWIEVQEEMEKRRPKFFHIQYMDSEGEIGTAYKMWSFLEQRYHTYRKVNAR